MDLHEVSSASRRRHPWEVTRARFFQRVLADAGALAVPRAMLDVGAGDGYVARGLLDALPAGGEVVCLDPLYTDEDLRRFAAEPRAGLSFAREAPPRRFDVILLLDVIEHVPDDRAFVGEVVATSLAPGGLVLVTVPAWQPLFSAHDTALAHHRRYSPAAFRALLDDAGLVTVRGGGLFHSLIAPRLLEVAGEKMQRLFGRAPRAALLEPRRMARRRARDGRRRARARSGRRALARARAPRRLAARPQRLGALPRARRGGLVTATLVIPGYDEEPSLPGHSGEIALSLGPSLYRVEWPPWTGPRFANPSSART